MDQSELGRLQTYLGRLLGADDLRVKRTGADEAEVQVEGRKVADLVRDEDEGEVSYFFSLSVPRAKGAAKDAPLDESERARVQEILRRDLRAPALAVRARPRKTDSAEVYIGDEFVGVISRDEDEGELSLTVSILEIDLEEEK